MTVTPLWVRHKRSWQAPCSHLINIITYSEVYSSVFNTNNQGIQEAGVNKIYGRQQGRDSNWGKIFTTLDFLVTKKLALMGLLLNDWKN